MGSSFTWLGESWSFILGASFLCFEGFSFPCCGGISVFRLLGRSCYGVFRFLLCPTQTVAH